MAPPALGCPPVLFAGTCVLNTALANEMSPAGIMRPLIGAIILSAGSRTPDLGRLAPGGYPDAVQAPLLSLLLLVIIGGGLKLAGLQLPILDYPLGRPFNRPHIDVVQPDLGL